MIKLKTIDCQDELEKLVLKKGIIWTQRKLEYEQLLDKIRFLDYWKQPFIYSDKKAHQETTIIQPLTLKMGQSVKTKFPIKEKN